MKTLLLFMIALLTAAYDAVALFFAWMTLGFGGTGWLSLLFVALWLATAAAVTVYGVDRWRKVRRGQQVRI